MKNLKKFAALGLSAAMVLSLADQEQRIRRRTRQPPRRRKLRKQKRQEILRLREIRQRPAETWTRARS